MWVIRVVLSVFLLLPIYPDEPTSSARPGCAGQVPKSDHPRASLDHLVGSDEERWWDREAQRLCGGKVQYQFEFGRLLDRKVTRLCPPQNLVDIVGGVPELI